MTTPDYSDQGDVVPLTSDMEAAQRAFAAFKEPAAAPPPVSFTVWHQQNLRWIVDRNPFYLLSAVCLILGCWLLGSTGQSLSVLSAQIGGLVAYEALAVPLTLWLAKQRNFGRDAAILSVLVVFLAADFTFFYSQAATENRVFACAAACFGAAQSLAVVGWLIGGFKVRLTQAGQWLLAADFLAIHLMPLAMSLLFAAQAGMTLALLGVAVLTGLLAAAHGLPGRWRHGELGADEARRLTRVLAWLTPAVALVSLVAHGVSVQWVYEIRFGAVHWAPLVLGAAALLLGLDRKQLWPDHLALKWACALAVVGALLTWGDDMGMTWNVGHEYASRPQAWFGFSPMRGASLAAAALLFGAWRMERRKLLLFLATCALGLGLLGHSMKAAASHVEYMWSLFGRLFSGSSGLMPTTRAGWGVVLFVGAFVLLGAGALLSRWSARKVAVKETEAGHE